MELKSALCNYITKEIILWCKERDIWLSTGFIAGKDNVKADALKKEFNLNLEWSLNDDIFAYLCTVYGQPDIDLFASRLNKKLSRYYSLFPDPYAIGINAFAHKWDEFLYIYTKKSEFEYIYIRSILLNSLREYSESWKNKEYNMIKPKN